VKKVVQVKRKRGVRRVVKKNNVLVSGIVSCEAGLVIWRGNIAFNQAVQLSEEMRRQTAAVKKSIPQRSRQFA
jgi:cell division protein FtsI/penicillin-binding protein 2